MERERRISRLQPFLVGLLLACIVYFSLFRHLGAGSLNIWDESRLAVSAIEMAQNGHWFIPTYDFKPDMWNVKPPLMIILQALTMKVVGFNELAVRLPSALAAFATLAMLFWFCVRQLNNLLLGFCSVLFLCTSPGYVSLHVARTGDYDALLILFLVCYFLTAVTFLRTRRYIYYLLFALFLLLASFTKGVAAAFFLPGVGLLFLLDVNFRKECFRLKYILPLAVVLGCIASYYLLREWATPGYLKSVIYWEIRGRLFNPRLTTHDPWYACFARIVNSDFNPWWLLIPLALPAYGRCGSAEKYVIRGIALTLIMFWIPLTVSISKFIWYGAAALPLLSLVASITFVSVSTYFFAEIKNAMHRRVAITVLIVLVAVIPLHNAFSRANPAKFAEQQEWEQKTMLRQDVALADLIKANRIPDKTTVISNAYNSPLDFYQKALSARGVRLIFLRPQKNVLEDRSNIIDVDGVDTNGIEPGDTVLVLSRAESETMKQRFRCEVIYSAGTLELLAVKERIL